MALRGAFLSGFPTCPFPPATHDRRRCENSTLFARTSVAPATLRTSCMFFERQFNSQTKAANCIDNDLPRNSCIVRGKRFG